MATKESRRVMSTRKLTSDRISFVVPKGLRHLVRCQALREGVSAAEMMRQAILARCGLVNMPDITGPDFEQVKAASTRGEAEQAIARLQYADPVFLESNPKKEKTTKCKLSVGYSGRNARINYTIALLALLDALESVKKDPGPGNDWHDALDLKVAEGAVPALRRLLSNIADKTLYDMFD